MRPLRSTLGLLVSVAVLTLAAGGSVAGSGVAAGPTRASMPAIGAQPTCSTCPDLRLGLAEFVRLLRGGHVLVVDVRDRASYRRAHLPGALSIPLDALEREATLLRSSDVHIVTYCDDPTGEPSVQAAHVLRGLGVAQAQALEGGFARWVAEGHVVVTQPSVEWHFVRHTV